MDKKTGPAHMLPTRDPSQYKVAIQIESGGWKKIFQAKGQEKKNPGQQYLYQTKQTSKQRP